MCYDTTRRAWWLAAALVTGVLVGGCAAQPGQETAEAEEPRETVDDILSEPLGQEEYVRSRRCISELAFRDFDVLDDRYLVFEGSGGKLWLNELRGRCPGLDRASSLAFRNTGFQVCELDRFEVTDMFAWPRYQRWPWRWGDGIPCTLGRFQPVSPEQLEALEASLQRR